MKLKHLALFAAVLLLAHSIEASWISWGAKETKPEEAKAEDKEPKSAPLIQKDEENPNLANDPLDEDDEAGYNDPKMRMPIEDEDNAGTEEIRTIHSLPEPGQTNFTQTQPQTRPYTYDENSQMPQNSPFVDGLPHPTQSQGPDPRFARPRQCQEGQYLCRKAHPQQEHIRCIPNNWKCNGVRDCEENDDEEGCAVNAFRPQAQACTQEQYTCYGSGINGIPAQCVEKSKICNGVYDCSYGDDEDNDRCTQFAVRPREGEIDPRTQPQQPPQQPQTQPQPEPVDPRRQPRVQEAPQYPPQPAPSGQCSGLSEDHVKRLEWTDRCIRSCLSNNRH